MESMNERKDSLIGKLTMGINEDILNEMDSLV